MEAIPELDAPGLRKFGLTFGAIVAGLFGALLPWLFGLGYPAWPWLVGLLFGTWGLAAPRSLNGFYRAWMRFGLLLNAVMSRLILAILFFGLITPTGWVIRLAGRDPLARRRDPAAASYRTPSKPRPPSHMERPF